MLTYLYQLTSLFQDYFTTLNEESIRDNFVIIYELLDETMDHGLPQSLDSTILRQFITQEGNRMADDSKSKPPVALTNAVSWRAEGIKHKKNEIFLDVVEKLNLLVAANGTVLHSEINGAVKMRSFLSGMPELKLGLNDKLVFEAAGRGGSGGGASSSRAGKSVELEDIKFHQCVRLARFENDRTISFIPPDGEFDLMTYRLDTHVKPLIWVEAVVEPHRGSRIEYMIKTRSQFKSRSVANNVEIIIPVPPDVDSPSFKSEMVRSFSNRASRTHWWNLMSSNSTVDENTACEPTLVFRALAERRRMVEIITRAAVGGVGRTCRGRSRSGLRPKYHISLCRGYRCDI